VVIVQEKCMLLSTLEVILQISVCFIQWEESHYHCSNARHFMYFI